MSGNIRRSILTGAVVGIVCGAIVVALGLATVSPIIIGISAGILSAAAVMVLLRLKRKE